MNEPSVFSGPEVTMPKDLRHLAGTVEHRDVHNLYGHYMHRATFEGLLHRTDGPSKRPFVLTRAVYAGSQRFAAKWTGDNRADWSHLAASVPMLLSLSLAGMPFVGADVGGFFGDPEPELLMRWYQLGALQPFFRAHAHIDTRRREPWLIAEPFQTNIKRAIRMRYHLLPYLYTLFRDAAAGGKPINRPLFMEFPEEKQLYDIDDQFMLGGALLVKPVSSPNVQELQVTLPTTAIWYSYHSLALQAPGPDGELSVTLTAEAIPIYVRGGSIIAKKERLRRSSAMMKDDPHTIYVFPDRVDGVAEGRLYIDDGTSYEYLDGQFIDVTFTLADGAFTWHHAQKAPEGLVLWVDRIIVIGQDLPSAVSFTPSPAKSTVALAFDRENEAAVVVRTVGVDFMADGRITFQYNLEKDDL